MALHQATVDVRLQWQGLEGDSDADFLLSQDPGRAGAEDLALGVGCSGGWAGLFTGKTRIC